jgi:hypothetical protein
VTAGKAEQAFPLGELLMTKNSFVVPVAGGNLEDQIWAS